MITNTNFQEKAIFRLYKQEKQEINRVLLAFPEIFTNQSHFYRVAVIKLLRELKKEANNTYPRSGTFHCSSYEFSSRTTPRIYSSSILDNTRMGLEVQEK